MDAVFLSKIIFADLSIKNNDAIALNVAIKITAVFQPTVPKPNLKVINAN